MSLSTVFNKSLLQTKKESKIKLLFLALGRIIINNPALFFFCSLLAIITALVNFNIGINFRNLITNATKEKTLSEQVIEEIENEKGDDIKKEKVKDIIKNNLKEKDKQQREIKEKIEEKIKGKESLTKKEIKDELEEIRIGERNVFKDKFEFEFNFFGYHLFKENKLSIWWFITCCLVLILLVKSLFSILHWYWMSYAYESVEKELKKDLFQHLIQAKYRNSSEISQSLITQFADDLDEIADNIWLIPNRLIYVAFSIFFVLKYEFNFGGKENTLPLLAIVVFLFTTMIIGLVLFFKKASKLNVAAKRRMEEDNRIIFERINNLEYIKAVSGEKYEEKKIARQLDSTFHKNKKSLLYTTLFKAVPQYAIIPVIPTIFMALVLTFFSKIEGMSAVFLTANFIRYFISVRLLNGEVTKIVESLLNLDQLSSNLTIVNESVKYLNRPTESNLENNLHQKNPFKNGNLVFKNVFFAYPKRPEQDILRNFSFNFQQGKVYGIAGKNGIGKSTIIKTTLKLYEIKSGEILVGKKNIQEIENANLHQRICYQTNRPTFFRMSIAENVFYPYIYDKKDYNKLVWAAKKVGIYEFINELPQGFDTILREGGSDLSEGQKQQISAMKIFINDYDIYILDEILSNVHPILTEGILDNIFNQLKNKTVLVIDHHYKIFKHVDYIYQFTGERLIFLDKEEFLANN
ncbi:MAG: Vitamin B12 import ATP-binding protein BtuD [Mycoplasmataceae bacterium]|nr:MAG: Vitamin B12 import ATP-binding protein BtuD [Mycoplasmataceae bacterium]